MDDFDRIYLTLTANLMGSYRVPWVESASREGTAYSRAYQDLWRAREHLCERFQLDWEDEDLERIMGAVLSIEQEIGRRMFESTIEYAKRGFKL